MISDRSFTMPAARRMMAAAAEKLIIPHTGKQQLISTSWPKKL
jgi:hypothetical protein